MKRATFVEMSIACGTDIPNQRLSTSVENLATAKDVRNFARTTPSVFSSVMG